MLHRCATTSRTVMVRKKNIIFKPAVSTCFSAAAMCFSSSSSSLELSTTSWILPISEEILLPSNQAFREAATQAGIRRIAFLRHGQTLHAKDGVDFNRQLTEQGRKQAKEAGRSFGQALLPLYPRVLVSPAPRTMETAQLFVETTTSADSTFQKWDVDLVPIQCIYDGTMQPEGSVLFRKIGYAPLRDYVDSEDEQDRAVARRVLGEYSTSVALEIWKQLASTSTLSSEPSPDMSLLVVGHAIYLPAAALGIAMLCECAPEYQRILLDTNTKEAQGFTINIQESTVGQLLR